MVRTAQQVRPGGRFAAGLGGLLLPVAATRLVLVSLRHVRVFNVAAFAVEAAFAYLLITGGIAFSRQQERGRRRLALAARLLLIWQACFLTVMLYQALAPLLRDPNLSVPRWVEFIGSRGFALLVAVWVSPTITVFDWLRSARVRDACRPPRPPHHREHHYHHEHRDHAPETPDGEPP